MKGEHVFGDEHTSAIIRVESDPMLDDPEIQLMMVKLGYHLLYKEGEMYWEEETCQE